VAGCLTVARSEVVAEKLAKRNLHHHAYPLPLRLWSAVDQYAKLWAGLPSRESSDVRSHVANIIVSSVRHSGLAPVMSAILISTSSVFTGSTEGYAILTPSSTMYSIVLGSLAASVVESTGSSSAAVPGETAITSTSGLGFIAAARTSSLAVSTSEHSVSTTRQAATSQYIATRAAEPAANTDARSSNNTYQYAKPYNKHAYTLDPKPCLTCNQPRDPGHRPRSWLHAHLHFDLRAVLAKEDSPPTLAYMAGCEFQRSAPSTGDGGERFVK